MEDLKKYKRVVKSFREADTQIAEAIRDYLEPMISAMGLSIEQESNLSLDMFGITKLKHADAEAQSQI